MVKEAIFSPIYFSNFLSDVNSEKLFHGYKNFALVYGLYTRYKIQNTDRSLIRQKALNLPAPDSSVGREIHGAWI